MQELIKIQKSEIGAEITNSVNARELHKTLEVRKDFSDWIKNQINRAGLEEDKDFIKTTQKSDLLPQKGEQLSSGAKWMTEYILTTDGAKHIAMISNTPKGKEVRDYLIEVEKRYIATLRNNSQDLQPFMMEIVKSNQATTQAMVEMNKNLEGLLKTIFNLANDFNRQKEDIREIKKYSEASNVNTYYAREGMAKIGETTQSLIEAGYEMKVTAETILKKINRTTIDSEQQALIVSAVNKRASGLKDMYTLDLKHIKIIIWTKLSEKFNVNTYREMKAEDFYKAMQFLDYVDIKNQDLEILEDR